MSCIYLAGSEKKCCCKISKDKKKKTTGTDVEKQKKISKWDKKILFDKFLALGHYYSFRKLDKRSFRFPFANFWFLEILVSLSLKKEVNFSFEMFT